jgi:hypothetical protein
MDIAGSVALVTGANGGIGRAFVAALLKRGAAKIYVAARDPDSLSDLLKGGDGRLVPKTWLFSPRLCLWVRSSTSARKPPCYQPRSMSSRVWLTTSFTPPAFPSFELLRSSLVHAQPSLSRFRSFSLRTRRPLSMRHSLLGIVFASHQPNSPPKHTASSDKGIVEAPPRLPFTSRHFAVMRNSVAIGAKRTSTKSRQSSI